MLNYIWAGLIIFSLVFALATDARDLTADRYRNGAALPVELETHEPYRAESRRVPVTVRIDANTYGSFYGVESAAALEYDGFIVQTLDGRELRFAQDASLPEPLATIRSFTGQRENQLLATLGPLDVQGDSAIVTTATFRPVRFVKLNAITEAAIDFAETAVSIAFSLIGVLALWLGLLKIADAAGLIDVFVRLIQPILRPLFPEIPKGHPAMGMIGLNLTANVLGLSNAATPLGIKAMEELQELNPTDDTATNSMVMFLALNTGSVQLVPPSLLVAVMGLQVNQLIFSITLATLVSTITGVIAARLLQNLPRYRKTNPGLPPTPPSELPNPQS